MCAGGLDSSLSVEMTQAASARVSERKRIMTDRPNNMNHAVYVGGGMRATEARQISTVAFRK